VFTSLSIVNKKAIPTSLIMILVDTIFNSETKDADGAESYD